MDVDGEIGVGKDNEQHLILMFFLKKKVEFIASRTALRLLCVLWEYSEEDIKVYH